ncbi:MAG: benzoyl-CoA-dihydrodiol lyase [Proteobacteria bacterium]|nr:benzoyl-CoA-dihydrodiol lyase [Pseudomonadota bacterium]MCP4919748.1 benzoyl-CoA-dihydrodiol lyase [Pseudomonadota bacterium]
MAKAPDTPVSFDTKPYDWTHWKLELDGDVATLAMNIQEDGGMRPGYELKLNSYDMGVDIELYDAVCRVTFEHPEAKTVVVTSALDRVFCSGANIYMLASSSHPFKVNFCKYTNETRCSLEEPEMPTFIAALNGACAGGGYELAMACEQVYLIDDGSSAVSLPEVPLLGVLPGTGGLTRLIDKRKVRRDLADVFCTKAEGFRSRDAVKGRFVDGSFPRSKWADGITKVAREAADAYTGPTGTGIEWTPLVDTVTETGLIWDHVTLEMDRTGRTATLTVKAPTEVPPADADSLHAAGAAAWSLAAFRELERAIFHLRFNHLDLGLILIKTTGDGANVVAWDEKLAELAAGGDWLAIRTLAFQRRTLRRLDNMSRSMFALIEEGNAFSGVLFELALSADRSYMFLDDNGENAVTLGSANHGRHSMSNGTSRLANRFFGEPDTLAELLENTSPIDAEEAEELGLVTMSPDDIDWEDDVRIAIEERASMSPDALTGMEQNLRYCGGESMDNRIYGRLTAWQNWIFQRPNAVGDAGALTLYGQPERPVFDFRRT